MNRGERNAFEACSLESEPNTPPSCCMNSRDGSGFTCYHRTDVISEKYGSHNLYKHFARRHFTKPWKEPYYSLCYSLPAQYSVEKLSNKRNS